MNEKKGNFFLQCRKQFLEKGKMQFIKNVGIYHSNDGKKLK